MFSLGHDFSRASFPPLLQMLIYSCCTGNFPLQVSTHFSSDFLPGLPSPSSLFCLSIPASGVCSGLFVPLSFRDRHLHKAVHPTIPTSESWGQETPVPSESWWALLPSCSFLRWEAKADILERLLLEGRWGWGVGRGMVFSRAQAD